MLSIRRHDFITCWAYAEPSTLSIRGTNFRACSANGKMWTVFTCTFHAEHTRNEFYRTLSIRGNDFIACSAYAEPISSHAEHARKCLKAKYLGRIEYDFQKSRVTGSWDHMVSVSAKKVKTKISCLCTFQAGGGGGWHAHQQQLPQQCRHRHAVRWGEELHTDVPYLLPLGGHAAALQVCYCSVWSDWWVLT